MNNIKLTDFTFKELVFLSIRMEDAQKDALSKIAIIEKFENSETKDDLMEHHQSQFDIASVWRTQIQQAMIDVKVIEMINNN